MDSGQRQIISNSPADSTATRQPGISTQIAESQGSQSQAVRVEVTVIRARNVPNIKTFFGGKSEYFVTIAYQATTKKVKKTKTKSVRIDGQTTVWNQTLDAFFVQPSSHLILCLYAKRLTQRNLLIGTLEITIPTECESDISFVLGHGNGQGEQSAQPVTLYLTIIVPENRISPNVLPNIPTECDNTPAEEVPNPTHSRGHDQPTEPEHLLPPPDLLPVQSSATVPQDQGQTSLIAEAQAGLNRADEVGMSIDGSNTWEGVVGRIKWLMNTLSPVANLHPIAKLAYGVLSAIPQELSNQYQRDDKVRSLVKSMHDVFDFTSHEDTLKSIKPNSKQAEILALMLRDVCSCSDFIQSYTKNSLFLTRMLKNLGCEVEEKIQGLSTALQEHRRAFLDHAMITTEITAFQILNDVGSISAKVDGIFTKLEWVSSQVLDAALDAKIGEIPYKRGSRFTPDKGCLPGTRIAFLDFIVDWVNNPSSKRILVLIGLAGTGKSSIAHEIAHRFNEMHRLASSFIFVRKEQSKAEAYHLFTNLARNLADRYPLFKAALGRVIKDDTSLRLDTRDYGTLFRRLIREPLKDLPIVDPILVVIDALDESGDTTGEGGLHKFLAKNLSSLPSNLRILITSRPEDGIESAFLTAESVVIKHMNDHELAATTHDDILTFLRTRLHSRDFEQYGKALARRAEGLFQWAAVACGYILEPKPVRSRRGRIEHLLQSTANHHEQDLLTELYNGILKEHFTDEEAHSLFRSVVGRLLAAFEPLSIRSLTALQRHTSNDDDDDDDDNSIVETLRYLGSLFSNVTSSNDTLPIVPLHTSFRDFATDEEKSGVFYVDRRDAHLQLAHSCLSLVLNDLKFNICNLESSYLANKEVKDLEVRISKHLPPALSYACCFWGNHLGHLDFETDLFGKLQTFFEKKFLFWLEALSLMSGMNFALPALSYLRIWLASGHGASQTELRTFSLFINDASVFVQYFGMAMAKSASHVYLSALPFAPKNSLVSVHYSNSFPHTLHMGCGQLSHWPSSEMVISNVGASVASIALSPDGCWIVSGLHNGTICVWNTMTGEAVAGPFTGHTDMVGSVGFSPDGHCIVSGSNDQTICVWNATTGEVVAGPFIGHRDWVRSVGFSPDGHHIVSGSHDRTICVWNAITGEVVAGPFTRHIAQVTSVGFSPDGQWIVSGSEDQKICVCKTMTGEAVAAPFTGHTHSITSVRFSPDGHHIVSGSNDQTICVWNVMTGEKVAGPITGHTHWVTSVAFSPDGQKIVSGSFDRTICVWDAITGEAVAGPFTGHNHWVSSVIFSPDGQQIISGSFDHTIRVWNVTTREDALGPFTKHTDQVTSVGFSSDSQRIVSHSDNKATHAWNTTTGEPEPVAGPFTGHMNWVRSVGFSPDGQWIVSGSDDQTICVWNAKTGEAVVGPFTGHTDLVSSVGFSPDGQHIVSGSWDQTIHVWNAMTGEAVAGPFTGHKHWVNSVEFSPDGQQVVSCSDDQTIYVWDAMTGEVVAGPFTGHKDRVSSVRFSSNGQWIVSSSDNGTICVWNAMTGEAVIGPFVGHTDRISSVAFSPNGQQIVSGSNDQTICVWNSMTGEAVAGPFTGHMDRVSSVAFSPDGQWIVSGSNDKTIYVWSTMTGEPVAGPLTGHTDLVSSVAFSPDGKWIVSGSYDQTIRLWNVTTGVTAAGPFTGHTGTHSVRSMGFLSDGQPIVSSGYTVDFTDQSVIDDDGWVRGNKGELIMWIPLVHRAHLHRPSNIWVTGEHETRLDLSNFVHGHRWIGCIDS